MVTRAEVLDTTKFDVGGAPGHIWVKPRSFSDAAQADFNAIVRRCETEPRVGFSYSNDPVAEGRIVIND